MSNDTYLGSFEYDASQEKGMKWWEASTNYELNFQHTIIGDFLVAQGIGNVHKHIHPIHDQLKYVPPFPPLAEAHKRAKDKGLI